MTNEKYLSMGIGMGVYSYTTDLENCDRIKEDIEKYGYCYVGGKTTATIYFPIYETETAVSVTPEEEATAIINNCLKNNNKVTAKKQNKSNYSQTTGTTTTEEAKQLLFNCTKFPNQ